MPTSARLALVFCASVAKSMPLIVSPAGYARVIVGLEIPEAATSAFAFAMSRFTATGRRAAHQGTPRDHAGRLNRAGAAQGGERLVVERKADGLADVRVRRHRRDRSAHVHVDVEQVGRRVDVHLQLAVARIEFACVDERSSAISLAPRCTFSSCVGAVMFRSTTVWNSASGPRTAGWRRARSAGRSELLRGTARCPRVAVEELLGLVVLVRANGVGAAVRGPPPS